MSWFWKLIKDYFQLGYVQPLKLSEFRAKWKRPGRDDRVEWWYLVTSTYYHYFAERWGQGHRVSWKIDKKETALAGVEQFRPKAGPDSKVGILLTEEIVSAM